MPCWDHKIRSAKTAGLILWSLRGPLILGEATPPNPLASTASTCCRKSCTFRPAPEGAFSYPAGHIYLETPAEADIDAEVLVGKLVVADAEHRRNTDPEHEAFFGL